MKKKNKSKSYTEEEFNALTIDEILDIKVQKKNIKIKAPHTAMNTALDITYYHSVDDSIDINDFLGVPTEFMDRVEDKLKLLFNDRKFAIAKIKHFWNKQSRKDLDNLYEKEDSDDAVRAFIEESLDLKIVREIGFNSLFTRLIEDIDPKNANELIICSFIYQSAAQREDTIVPNVLF